MRALLDWCASSDQTFYTSACAQTAGDVVFEGAQGVLLDESFGFYPHVTWTDTTTANAIRLLAEADYNGPLRKLGVVRTYATRHGAGPLVTEDASLAGCIREPHNTGYEWAGGMRFGHFDAVATRYALEVTGGVDALAITHVDDVAHLGGPRICHAYELDGRAVDRLPIPAYPVDLGAQQQLTERLFAAKPRYAHVLEEDMPTAIGASLGVPIALRFSGPTSRDVSRASAPRAEAGRSWAR